jgi:RimJ/RimL family protein N-acetyltransferase
VSRPRVVRRIAASEAARLRDIRLRLLADVPWRAGDLAVEHAFGSDYWEERARTAAAADDRAGFVIEAEERWVGIVETMPAEDPTAAEIHGFWVDPNWRRRGHGVALLEAAGEWAGDTGFDRLVSWVRERNQPAIAAHQRAGFRLTEVRIRWPERAAWQAYMVRDLP